MAFYGTGFGMPAPTVVGGFPSYGAPMGAPIAYGAPSFGGQIVDGSDAGSVASGSYSGAPAEMSFAQPMGFGGCGPCAQPQQPVFEQPCAQPVFEQPCNTCEAVLPMRRPGYTERYIAWKNRQKAFNKYKKLTKQAIRDSENLVPSYAACQPVTYAQPCAQPVTYTQPCAQPVFSQPCGPCGDFGGFPQTFAQPFPMAAPMMYPSAQSYSGDYSQAAENVEDVPAAEEPEIRGTQV